MSVFDDLQSRFESGKQTLSNLVNNIKSFDLNTELNRPRKFNPEIIKNLTTANDFYNNNPLAKTAESLVKPLSDFVGSAFEAPIIAAKSKFDPEFTRNYKPAFLTPEEEKKLNSPENIAKEGFSSAKKAAGFLTAAAAPITGIQSAALGAGSKIVSNIRDKKPFLNDTGKAATEGLGNAAILQITNSVTDKILSKVAPFLTQAQLGTAFNVAKNATGTVKNQLFILGVKRTIERALAEVPMETLAFGAEDSLENKKKFTQAVIDQLPGNILGNLLYAGISVGGQGVNVYGQDVKQALSDVIQNVMSHAKLDEKGGIDFGAEVSMDSSKIKDLLSRRADLNNEMQTATGEKANEIQKQIDDITTSIKELYQQGLSNKSVNIGDFNQDLTNMKTIAENANPDNRNDFRPIFQYIEALTNGDLPPDQQLERLKAIEALLPDQYKSEVSPLIQSISSAMQSNPNNLSPEAEANVNKFISDNNYKGRSEYRVNSGLNESGTIDLNAEVSNPLKGLPETVQNSDNASPELKQVASEINPQTYDPISNPEAMSAASTRIEASPQDAKAYALDPKEPLSAEKGAVFYQLIQKASADGNKTEMEALLNAADQQGRAGGQFNQIASLWSALRPQDVVSIAEDVAAKHGVTLDGETTGAISSAMDEINSMKDGIDKSAYTATLLNYIADKIPPTKGELFDSFRYQNMLSGPRTSERNIYSNLLNTFVTRPADLVLQAGYDIVRHPFDPLARDVELSDVADYYKQVFTKMPDALGAAKEAFKNVPDSTKFEDNGGAQSAIEDARKANIPGALTAVPRSMEAQDKFFTTLIASGEKARLLANGVDDETATAEASKIAQDYLLRTQLGKTDTKDEDIFSRALDALGEFAIAGRKLPVVGKPFSWFVPFITTPVNWAKINVQHSPLGFAGGKLDDAQLAKATGGTIATAFAALLASQGRTTWTTPTDPKAKALFYDAGKKPYSVSINGKWVPLAYFGPFGLAMAIPAAIKEYNDNSSTAPTDDVLSKIFKIATSTSRYLINQTPLQGVSSFFKILDGDIDYNSEGLVGNTLGQAIPFESLLRYVSQIVDPVYRKPKGGAQSFLSGIPGYTKQLEAYVTTKGDQAKRDVMNFFLPYDVGTNNDGFDKQFQERMDKLQQNSINREQKAQDEQSATGPVTKPKSTTAKKIKKTKTPI